MRLTHSFWSKPSLENRWGIKNSFFSNIWIAALSCIYAKNSGNYITMHCDSYSYKYLKHFPYDEIHVDLDCLNNIKSKSTVFWAAGKSIALEKEPIGTIHIDLDVFIKSDKCVKELNFNNYDLIILNTEDCSKYPDIDHFKNILPEYILKQKKAYNVGIIGFNNKELKDKYLDNYNYWLNNLNDQRDHVCIDLILELMYIKYLSENYKVKELFKNNDNLDFQQIALYFDKCAKNIDYTHLIGHSKYHLIDLIINKVKKLNLQLYLKLIQEGVATDLKYEKI